MVDLAVASCSFCYLLLYSFLYHVVYRVRRSRHTSGARARWRDGPFFRNRWVPEEGFRVELGQKFTARHGNKFLGMGEPVADAPANF